MKKSIDYFQTEYGKKMNLKHIRKFKLNFFDTLAYFIDHIQCDRTLSETLIKKIDFMQGDFFTLLPANTNIENISKLSQGGILPSKPFGLPIYKNDNPLELFQPQCIQTMDLELCKFINGIISKNKEKYIVIENYMLDPCSKYVEIPNVKMIPFNNEVYYFLNEFNSIKDIEKTIKKSNEIWHFLMMVTKINFSSKNKLEVDEINYMCDNTDLIITCAYDGEGYIFWEKHNP
jgi:hypothetical protein